MPIRRATVALSFAFAWSFLTIFTPRSLADDAKPTFEERVLPIFKARCVKCHAGAEPAAGLRLTTRREILRGGDSGPAMRVAAAESSLVWEKLASNEMPTGGPPLSAEEKGAIRSWINEGAPSSREGDSDAIDDAAAASDGVADHWAFKPPMRPSIPQVTTLDRVRNPIDAFLLASLERQELSFSPEADRQALLRRATYDLIGLPPSPEEVQAFMADDGELAYQRAIERLLASPAYGERWGRHWLDVAGYADSAGVLAEDRPLPNMFRYRDYVITAFNADKPYDRFLQEQLAGDELSDYWTAYETLDRLPESVIEAVTATGFLRCAPDASRPDFSTIKNADAQYFYPTINDTLQIVASSTMGLTLQCARCHSHKFDPIPQVEYYRLQAIFMGAYRPKQWIPQMERLLPIASAKEKRAAEEHNARLDAEIARLKQEQAKSRDHFKQRLFDERLAALPEAIRADVQTALAKRAEERTEIERYLAEKFQATLQLDDAALDKLLPETYPEYRTGVDERTKAIAEQERRRAGFDEIRALYDLSGPVETPLLRRGDALTPGPPVEPGVLTSLQTPEPFAWSAPPATGESPAKTSGRRLAFARWLTQPDHPLVARVIVNRVWLHHFGEGIVSTPEDFGALGAAPSHPELLDWLARELVDSGWSLKHIHRLIVTSSAYRQRSFIDPFAHESALAADPDNRLLWRQRMRRLDAEPVRDGLLAAAGLLDRSLYGRSIPVARRPDGDVTIADGQNDRRRSIYVQILRGNPLTMLLSHDQPVMETNCTRRNRSTVATQALTLQNSDEVARYAASLAERARRESPERPAAFAAFVAFSREASPEELAEYERLLAKQNERYAAAGEAPETANEKALADLCQMLLASNEFVYID